MASAQRPPADELERALRQRQQQVERLYRNGIEDPQLTASLIVEDRYWEILGRWARSEDRAARRSAPGDLSDLAQQVIENFYDFEVTAEAVTSDGAMHKPRLRSPEPGRNDVPLRLGIICLREVQQNSLEQLAEVEPESLLALSFFYLLVYIDQLDITPRPWLAGHSRRRALALVDVYLERAGDTPEARANAARVLIAMADHLRSLPVYERGLQARELFVSALELDPGNLAARYWAAFLYEKYADYRKATKHLALLAAALPGDEEVRLRLALNRGRIGKRKAAVETLRDLARGPAPDWVRIAAYQELAQNLAPDSETEAAAVLRTALEAFPDDGQLALQLAYFRRGDWQASAALVEETAANWPVDAGNSPRVLYDIPREEEIKADYARLVWEIENRLPALTRGLAELTMLQRESRPVFVNCFGALPL